MVCTSYTGAAVAKLVTVKGSHCPIIVYYIACHVVQIVFVTSPRDICPQILSLSSRVHVVMRLFSNRSQMTSKYSKNKEVAHEPLDECVTDVFTAC